jgi:hypothetical protein
MAGVIPPSLDQRRRALALLVSALRIYGPDDEATEAECIDFQRTGEKMFDIPPGTVGRISSGEVVAAMLAEDRHSAALTVLVSAYRIHGPPPTLLMAAPGPPRRQKRSLRPSFAREGRHSTSRLRPFWRLQSMR